MSDFLPNLYNILSASAVSESFDILDVLLDALLDTAKMLPFLFLAFLLMEFIEHRAGNRLAAFLERTGGRTGAGSVAGALLGCVPQCGFSVAASNLYAGRIITTGALVSVFVSTSDEAVPVLLAHPEMLGTIWKLLAVKVAAAIAAGIVTDVVIKACKIKTGGESIEEMCSEIGCGCGDHGIWYSALRHSAGIALFILTVNLILGAVMALLGGEAVKSFFDALGVFSPFAAGLVGMIPNCAASVLITELYADGAVTFGTAVSGLCTGAGVGLAVLFRTNKNLKENLAVTGIVYLTGVICGIIIDLSAV